jgi:hypothetical protein
MIRWVLHIFLHLKVRNCGRRSSYYEIQSNLSTPTLNIRIRILIILQD